MTILVTELAVLAILTVAAIGTDSYWSGQLKSAAAARKNKGDHT